MMPPTSAIHAQLNAIKAFGIVVTVDKDDFRSILMRQDAPLVVHAEGGILTTKHRYLTSYKGLAFVTVQKQELQLPAGVERIEAEKISMPDM